jgi:hypothetical protein
MNKIKLRFLMKTKFNLKTDCWEWKASTHKSGYGHFWMNNKLHRAHRASYIIYKGNIPKNLLILHKCDVKKCVNPEHLFLGTNKDNTNDMFKKGRQRFLKGTEYNGHKLNAKKVRNIRTLYKNGEYTQRELAKIYNVSQRLILNVIKNRAWKHIL